MFDIGFWEILIIGVVGLIVVGPERLPAVATFLGHWVGRVRRFANHMREEIQQELETEQLKNVVQEQNRELQSLRKEVAEVRDDAGQAIQDTRAATEGEPTPPQPETGGTISEPAPKEGATSKTAAKKSSSRKAAAKKGQSKKSSAKKASAKKSSAKKSPAKKSGAKKTPSNNTTANKSAARSASPSAGTQDSAASAKAGPADTAVRGDSDEPESS